ncbi:unnamed protein product [Peronospora destructor]|uniref:Paf1 complex subunit Cdc73 N-terminal domain-containing protein n=1 Tax=Peronospora destructor TaxID=86335 RepID=A0AAV0UD02_9STRA|nr:unnamed protein product [Peronospora destructor]
MASATITPLAALRALREHLIAGKNVSVEDEFLVFYDVGGTENHRLPKHSATAYYSKKLDKSYDLLAVYTCFKHETLSFSDYVLKCREEKAAMVSTVDKKELVAYLKGDIESSLQILDANGQPTTKRGEKDRRSGAKKTREDAKESSSVKKRKMLQEQEKEQEQPRPQKQDKTLSQMETEAKMKRMMDKEYVIRTRTTVLDAHKTKFDNVIQTLELVNAETKEKIEKATKASALVATTTARKNNCRYID